MKDQSKTPFFSALKEYAESKVTPFDVPGHHLGNINDDFNKYIGKKVLKLDANAPKGLDSLFNPKGVIKEAEDLFSECFNSDKTYFLVNGTTIGIISMIMSSCNHNEKIILPRNCHKSAINGLIISGAVPIFVEPQIDENLGITTSVTYESYEKAILENPDCFAVFIINPTYFGVTTDIEKITKLAHEKNMLVLVDEAHGSHFKFSNLLPLSAMDANCDLSSLSIHKTGGSLTQSSVLLAKGNRINYKKIQNTINILQSTSPNSLLLASLDSARKNLYFNSKSKLEDIINYSHKIRKEINKIKGFFSPNKNYFLQNNYDYDETKLVIKVSKLNLTGFDLYRILKDEYNIQMELAEKNVILGILSIGSKKKHLDNLVLALKDISSKYYKEENVEDNICFDLHFPKMKYRPRVAYVAPKIQVYLDSSIGKICAEQIMIYPPGIPLIIPGEIISQTFIDNYKYYLNFNCVILSESDEKITIVDEENWEKWNNIKYDEI